MRQLQQNFQNGELTLAEIPIPQINSGDILVDTHYSLVSAGTERAMIDLAKKSLVGKAKERPDLLRQVVRKARNDGLIPTYRTVKSRLEEPQPLGYSCAGEVLAVGEDVTDISVGDRVACGGTGYATHAELNRVPENLCVQIPEATETRDAAFTTIGAIAMQGLRRLDPTPGERFAVIGLGLVGRLTTKILDAYGHPTLGLDINPAAVANATELSESAVIGEDDVERIAASFGESEGVDGVIITAATDSNDPIERAGQIVREQGRVSIVGDVGMDIPRDPYYDKELDLRLSRSYGPGRYDRTYEESGLDYPISHVRWTENRNMKEFLRLINEGRVDLTDLVSHTFDFSEALDAYDLILEGSDHTGVVLEYHPEHGEGERERRLDIDTSKRSRSGILSVGVIGAGNFATGVLLPTIQDIDTLSIDAVASLTGTSGKAVAEKYGAAYTTTDYGEIVADKDIDLVIVVTRHDRHADIATDCLAADKDVHVEKPPALDQNELNALLAAEQDSNGRLMVGYNRRFAEPTRRMKETIVRSSGPAIARYRINADTLPADHWTLDPEEGGGRIIGEVCHFVDLLQYLVDSPPTRVYACGPTLDNDAPTRQNLQAVVEFEDGSTGTITYTTLGNRTNSKEHVEVFAGGNVETIDNFKTGRFSLNQDKGFAGEFKALTAAIKQGDPSPIPADDIAYTSEATFALRESLRAAEPITIRI